MMATAFGRLAILKAVGPGKFNFRLLQFNEFYLVPHARVWRVHKPPRNASNAPPNVSQRDPDVTISVTVTVEPVAKARTPVKGFFIRPKIGVMVWFGRFI